MEFNTKNAEETKELGKKLAVDLVAKDKPLVIALTGELGSGKTTFVQGFADGLGVKHRIVSPTFIILRKYLIKSPKLRFENLYHLDLYRLEGNINKEVKSLGIEEIWYNPKSIVIIEWAEKIKDLIPKQSIWIRFESLNENLRKITTL